VPGVPPTSAKHSFAWDRPPGIKPGADRGNVLLNAHTWPDGSAVGNEMLDELYKGDRIVLRGARSELCYTVTQRIEVRFADGYPPYFDRNGSPKVALIVCSGKRLGPGDWTHRTIWFAEPTA
jgi:sortase (surface protein transpeptidase)